MGILKPPSLLHDIRKPSLFLAGSIEQDTAARWQDDITKALEGLPGTLLNPRRDHWGPTWKQSIDNPEFLDQVTWELEALERADMIAMYFDPATKSPVTLLELGMYVSSRKLVVCCPDGYWRKGNVDIVCRRYCVPMVPDLPSLIEHMKSLWVRYA